MFAYLFTAWSFAASTTSESMISVEISFRKETVEFWGLVCILQPECMHGGTL